MNDEDTPLLPGLELVAPFVQHTEPGKSNTVELFDALVLLSTDHSRQNEKFLDATKVFRGRTYHVRMSPAVVKRRDGKPAMILPGARENLVEKVLRKIAAEDVDSVGVTLRDGNAEVWVKFSIYKLRKTLAEQGHHFTTSQLAEALTVMQGCKLSVTGETADEIAGIESGILQTVIWRKAKRGDKEGESYRVCAKLHPFITRSILARTFRQIDFARLMRPKNELARWLYIRLSHNYTQAAEDDLVSFHMGNKRAGYHISLSSIIRETAISYSDTRMALRAVRTALAVLRSQDVLRCVDMVGKEFQGWCEDITLGEARGGRKPIKDVLFTLFPSQAVIEDIIKANRIAKQLSASVGR